MAWQSPSAMNAGGAPGGADGNGPAGTEYTLQGVMRFLQLEWHNHERARNAWDIERAEMKAKIAKQEGEVRSAKKLNDSLSKRVRMLEQALTNERNKGRAASEDAATSAEESKDTGVSQPEAPGSAPPQKPPDKPHNSFPDIGADAPTYASRSDAEGLRARSKVYLAKCVEEITYLLAAPPPQPPPPQGGMQALTNGPFLNANDVPLEELYLHNRHRMQPHMAGVGPSLTNHQPPSAVASDAHDLSQMPSVPPQASIMAREASGALSGPSSLPSSEELDSQSAPAVAAAHGPHMEKLSPAFEERNRGTEEDDVACQIASDDADAWDFEELARPPETSAELAPSRRPDTDVFPSTNSIPTKSPPRSGPQSHRRKSSGSASVVRRRMEGHESRDAALGSSARSENQGFKLRFALRGHLDVVRSVLFTGGGSPSEPEICTAGDDGMIKRWIIPASYASQHGAGVDLDIQSYFSHRGHDGVVTCLAACPASTSFSTGGRLSGDGWIFSGGQDATVRVWERGRVDPKATLEGHTDAVWTVCVLPATSLSVFGPDCSSFGGPDRLLLGSGSADGTIKLWAVSAPPQLMSPQTGSRRGIGGSRRQSVTSGSNFPSSPQPSIATTTPFHHVLVRTIERPTHTSPTCIRPLSMNGETFVVSFSDSSILVFDTRSGEEIIGMASGETYDGSPATGINAIVATSIGTDGSMGLDSGRGLSEDESVVHAPTGSSGGGGVEGVVISGHEDQFIRFFDANSGQCTYSMLAHPSAISSLSLSKDGREAVSAGHDASIRFWSLEKRICTQEMTSHRPMRGEGVCSVVWSQDGRLVVSAGGDGVVKVFAR